MTRQEYMNALTSKDFIFIRSQKAWPGKLGEEDVYRNPKYTTSQFYVTRIDKNRSYGFNPQRKMGAVFDEIFPHNAKGDKDYLFWLDDAFVKLMDRL